MLNGRGKRTHTREGYACNDMVTHRNTHSEKVMHAMTRKHTEKATHAVTRTHTETHREGYACDDTDTHGNTHSEKAMGGHGLTHGNTHSEKLWDDTHTCRES